MSEKRSRDSKVPLKIYQTPLSFLNQPYHRHFLSSSPLLSLQATRRRSRLTCFGITNPITHIHLLPRAMLTSCIVGTASKIMLHPSAVDCAGSHKQGVMQTVFLHYSGCDGWNSERGCRTWGSSCDALQSSNEPVHVIS